MSRTLNWHARAMYILVTLALILGLTLTASLAPAAAHTPEDGYFDIDDGQYLIDGNGIVSGYFTGDNYGIDEGPYYVEAGFALNITDPADSTAYFEGSFWAQVWITGDEISFWGEWDGPPWSATLTVQGGYLEIDRQGRNQNFVLEYDATDAQDFDYEFRKRGYIGVPQIEPEFSLDVKGAVQKFVIVNAPYYDSPIRGEHDGLTADSFEKYIHYATLKTTLEQLQARYCANVTGWDWEVVRDPENVGVDYMGGGNAGQGWLELRMRAPGDCRVSANLTWVGPQASGIPTRISIILGEDGEVEKKWGVIDHTIMDLDPPDPVEIPPQQDNDVSFKAGNGGPESRTLHDWVYTWYYTMKVGGEEVLVGPGGHAIVHWWLIKDNADNRADINEIMDDLGRHPTIPDTAGGTWVYDYPPFELTPKERIDEVWNGNEADFTGFTNGVDDFYYLSKSPDWTYIETVTQDSFPGEYRGLSPVKVENVGEEDILVVTLTEYPYDFHGENPICIELGFIEWEEKFLPEIEMKKTPQLRWAGEKIVLEIDWSEFFDPSWLAARGCYAEYKLELGGVGNLEVIDEGFKGAQEVHTELDDGISRVILVSEQSGQADVNVELHDYYTDELYANYGFLVYFLEFEEVALAEDITPASSLAGVPADESVDVAVQVKGFFDYRHSHLMATTRDEKLLDLDQPGDPGYGEADVILPAGRYVLPDDWWKLAGTKDVSDRPNYDLMDRPDDNITSNTTPLGPFDEYVATTAEPGEAEYPTIGPFSTLQHWSSELMWVTEATVPADMTVAPADDVWDDDDVRNTVVPDGHIDWYDAPMPQALVTFEVTYYDPVVNHSLSGLNKTDLLGYGYTGNKTYHSPFYAVEIPAHWAIPAGYDWDSWVARTTTDDDDGPYPFWTDLGIKSRPGDPEPNDENPDDVEVYSDNHGIAGVTVEPLVGQGSLEITATADYPYTPMKGKYGPRVSPPITIGARTDLNPHFTVDKIEVAVGETVIFDPTSTYGGTMVGGTYQRARWDFDNDGVCDEDSDITGKDPLALTTWAYPAEGEYQPCLEITDFSVPVVVRTECMTDPYTIVVGAGLTEIDWVCPLGDAPLTAPNPGAGRPMLVSDADPAGITVDPTTEELWGIYYLIETGPQAGTWLYYIPGFGVNTLNMLETDEYYFVVVSDACTLTVPQV